MFVNEVKFVQVSRIYTYLNKIYGSIVTGIVYFWKQDDYTLKMPSFLKYCQGKSKQFSTKQVIVIAPQKSS